MPYVLFDENIPRSLMLFWAAKDILAQTEGQRRYKGKSDEALLEVVQHKFHTFIIIDQGILPQQNIARSILVWC